MNANIYDYRGWLFSHEAAFGIFIFNKSNNRLILYQLQSDLKSGVIRPVHTSCSKRLYERGTSTFSDSPNRLAWMPSMTVTVPYRAALRHSSMKTPIRSAISAPDFPLFRRLIAETVPPLVGALGRWTVPDWDCEHLPSTHRLHGNHQEQRHYGEQSVCSRTWIMV